ncbi:MAG: hypothetical protein CO035_07265 [Candidatus Omnitrophica bacterium CG_4_9_14_0_2_um_filter_42_8]|nr:MAG: hypothetical protein COW92_02850 [Candidatus Omnitrophica bacterium CG22_combo_CG10-13_8_21_14_all_43_16]PJC47138.1 MAG: hypothetical protein CO035_07265 [Candidatus Omnitrophica bacterium CG_4_9_14_0_2_um_filter_42_8]
MKYTKIILPFSIKSSVLALGAQSKAGFCFAKGRLAYLSDAEGDLGDLKNFKKFEKGVKKLQRELKINPKIIACDLHPEYTATKYANELVKGEGWRVKKVQHHEAHIASCIADNKIKGKVIGIAFDGTGFGSDGNIWGGEFFVGNIKRLKRVAYLKYVPMPGGEASIREPWRMAFSYLYGIYGSDMRLLRRFAPRNDSLKTLIQVLNKKINMPLTSSMGRLFDGVSSLIGVCNFAGYEGEAAIRLEKIISARGSRLETQGKYKFKYTNERGMMIIDWGPVIRDVVKDLKRDVKKPEISLKFHNAICYMIRDVCNILRKKYRIKKVCMSGGVFQNSYLKNSIRPLLEKEGFKVFLHKNVPAHDGSISLGQAVLAGV